jgi:hypothetical protein
LQSSTACWPDSPVRVSFDEWTLWCDWDECVATNYDLRAGLLFAGTFNRIHERATGDRAIAAREHVGIIQTNATGMCLTAAYLVTACMLRDVRWRWRRGLSRRPTILNQRGAGGFAPSWART